MRHSAGAHLIALLAAAPDIVKRRDVQPWKGTILLDSSALDLVQIMNSRHLGFYDRVFGNDPAFWQSVSPFHRLSALMPPLLAVCSTRRIDACPQARAFVAKVAKLGARANVLPVDLTYAEINLDLGMAGGYTDSIEVFMRSLGVGG
jgi:acetyl esterase/lipase